MIQNDRLPHHIRLRRRTTRLVAVGMLLSLSGLAPSAMASSSATPSRVAPPPHPLDAQLREVVLHHLGANRSPAAAVVLREGGQTVWTAGFGEARDGSPVDAATRFGIGSLSKGVTGLLVAQLATDGHLDLDRPVEELLPALREPGTPETHRRLTPRHLLHHTSGLDVRGEHLFVEDSALERALSVWRRPLIRPAGEAFEYLNTNYLILGLIVEAVTGQTLESALNARIFSVLEDDISTEPEAAWAPAHQLWFGWPVHHLDPPRESLASGGITTDASTLSRLVDALGRGGRSNGHEIFDPAVVEAATTPGAAVDADSGYAMGWYRRSFAGHPTLSHGGSTPGYSAYALHQEDADRTIVVLTASWGAIWGSHTPIWIAADLLRTLEGEPLPERTPASKSYLWFDLLVLVSVASTLRSVRRLRGRAATLAALPEAARLRSALLVTARHLLLAGALAWFIPQWARFSLRSFLAVPSDVSLLMFFGISSGLLLAGAELWTLVRLRADRSRRGVPAPAPGGQPGFDPAPPVWTGSTTHSS